MAGKRIAGPSHLSEHARAFYELSLAELGVYIEATVA